MITTVCCVSTIPKPTKTFARRVALFITHKEEIIENYTYFFMV
jgi:hypothetical protein